MWFLVELKLIHGEADSIQNPEFVDNLKENCTLHDDIDYTGYTSVFMKKLEQWENSESLY